MTGMTGTKLLTPYRSNIALVALGIVILPKLTAEAMPRLLPPSLILTLCIAVSLAIAALAVNMLVGYAGQLSLGHAALLGVGAFSASVVTSRWGLTMALGLLAAIVSGGLVALVIGLPALRLRGLYLALVTMVFGLTMQASVLRWPFFTRGSAGAELPRRLWGDAVMTDPAAYLSVILFALLGVWLIDRNIVRTKLGRAFKMIREDETVARSFGIDVTRYKLTAFVLSGAIAGLAGALYGHTIGLVNSDVFPLDMSLRLVMFVIIGGIGRRWSVAVVAVLFSVTPELPEFVRGYELVIAAAIVLYNIVRLPTGLAGALDHLRHGRHAASVHGEAPTLPDLSSVVGETPEPATDGDLLTVEHVSVRFGALQATDDVSVRVGHGEIVGIIGPNGAGKSTFFNAVSGFVDAPGSRIHLDGQAVHDAPAHERARLGLGRTFQLVGLAKGLSVRDNILLAQHTHAAYPDAAALLYTPAVHRGESELAHLADEVVRGLGFESYAHTPVGNLSGGQQRIVELAAVLAVSPKLLMLVEPTAGLSPGAAENLADRLRDLRDERGRSILLIEHNVPLVLDLCDYVYVLNAGAVLAEGTARELAQKPEVLGAYLGEGLGGVLA